MANMGILKFFTVLILLGSIYCLYIVPERTNVTFYDPKYITHASTTIKRYGRKSPYYFNFDGGTKHYWTNNITIHFFFYEYLHNEYRRSFVEMHYKFCDLVNKELYVGKILTMNGVTCPAPPREYHLMNITVLIDNFPNVFPFEKGRVKIDFDLTDSGENIMKSYVDATFKAKKSIYDRY